MHVQETRAWFVLVVTLSTLVLYLCLAVLLKFHPATMGVFGLLGLVGVAPLIGRKAKKEGRIVMDERDHQIAAGARVAAFAVIWVLVVVAAILLLLIWGPKAELTVRTTTVAACMFPAMCLMYLVQSLVVVILYRYSRG